MLNIAVLLFYVSLVGLGIRFKWPKGLSVGMALACLIALLYYQKVYKLDVYIEAQQEIHGDPFGAKQSTDDPGVSPALFIPFALFYLCSVLVDQLFAFVDILIALATLYVYLGLGFSAALGLWRRSYITAVLSLLTFGAIASGFITAILVLNYFAPDLQLNTYFYAGIAGAFAASPVPVIGYWLLRPWWLTRYGVVQR